MAGLMSNDTTPFRLRPIFTTTTLNHHTDLHMSCSVCRTKKTGVCEYFFTKGTDPGCARTAWWVTRLAGHFGKHGECNICFRSLWFIVHNDFVKIKRFKATTLCRFPHNIMIKDINVFHRQECANPLNDFIKSPCG